LRSPAAWSESGTTIADPSALVRDDLTAAKEGPENMGVGADATIDEAFPVGEVPRLTAGRGEPPSLRPTEQQMELWCSPRMREVTEFIREAASVDVTVLITGETGTGKDVVARGIHQLSPRRGGSFVKVNCAAMPRELLETELFGHERGAFTGAHQLKVGKFEVAHGGTIFLDEIGDLHPALQGKLLHVLQDGEFARLGGKSTLKVDVRTIAATNQDLERAVAEGRFRQDLYYRLNVIQIKVPPLRERLEEVPALVNYFVDLYAKKFHRPTFALSAAALDALVRRAYPGNVRELENLVKRMIVLGEGAVSRPILTPATGAAGAAPSVPGPLPDGSVLSLRDLVRQASRAREREIICHVLDHSGWNRVRSAKTLKISYRALLYKMKQFGLNGHRSRWRPQ
jgi:transcriptional regulator with GAF, ATPase, and Fis domain